MSNEGIEKREYIRFSFSYPFKYRSKDSNKWINTKSDNISLGGMMFSSKKAFSKAEEIEILITHPLLTAPTQPIQASVIWSLSGLRSPKDDFMIGCSFISLTDEQKKIIKALIHECIDKLKPCQKYKILFIDDNRSLIKLFKCLSEEYYFTALTAETINEAIKIARKELPDVIITDIHMPDGDGFMLTARLKSYNETRKIPIIGASVTYAELGEKFFLSGGNKFINDKPTTIEKLNGIIEGILPRLNTEK